MVAGWFQVFCPEQWVRPAGVFCQWAVATSETTWDAPTGWGGHLPERWGFTHLHRQCHQRGTVQAQGWVPPTCQHSCSSSAVPSGLNTHPCPSNLLSIDLTAACDVCTQEWMRRQVVLLQGWQAFCSLILCCFVLVSQLLMPKRGNTGWADCRSARSTIQRPWARYDGVCWMFSWGHIYSWAQYPLLIPSLWCFTQLVLYSDLFCFDCLRMCKIQNLEHNRYVSEQSCF